MELTATVQRALALTQLAQPTWTRADLLKQLALVLPVQTRSMEPDEAVALLHEMADAAIDGLVEPVVCLEAPEWPPLPSYLRRDLDGRSVYTRPGTTRYATRVQLSLEEQLFRDAQRNGAPPLEPAVRLQQVPGAMTSLTPSPATRRKAAPSRLGLRCSPAPRTGTGSTSR